MGRYNVVIEGIDGAGKTTLARKLLSEFSAKGRLIRMGMKRPESRQELLLRLAQCKSEASLDRINIFDRLSAISEYVYGDNGGLTVAEVMQELSDCKIDLIIWAHPPSVDDLQIFPSSDQRDVEYTQKVKHKSTILYEAYKEIMKEIWRRQAVLGFKCLQYDYTAISTRIFQEATRHIKEGSK